MDFLADHHPVVGLGELVNGLVHGPAPEPGSVAVTFDDGYLEYASVVGEILLKRSIPATFFVVTGVLDGLVSMPGGPYLTWSDVRGLHASGLSIGSHTVTHRSLGALDAESVRHELIESRNRIGAELGTPPEGLAYPYGTPADVPPGITGTAQSAGYLYSATAVHGLNHPGCHPFLLTRTTLTAGDGPRTFHLIMKGCLDPWRLVDRWGYRLQHGES
jgi:peptidoglycan/xylan/chitin deacetylase (PgdA/CDA1 family)